ncbi:hypothetical protein WUBG_16099, partial [Wuchereria bancrofti]
SLNNNANSGIGAAVPDNRADQANRANQVQQNSFDAWQAALGAGLGFLAGNFIQYRLIFTIFIWLLRLS